MNAQKLHEIVIAALEDIKARDIETLDTRELTSLFDSIVVASADSGRQTRALAHNVQEQVKAVGGHVVSVEGENSGEWVLVDLGSIVVHIMQPAIRAYYNLEGLWSARPAERNVLRAAGE